jgi:hypothetical protein
LRNTLRFDEVMLNNMGGAIRRETLVAAPGSDPENTDRTTTSEQTSGEREEEQMPRRREPDLRTKLKEKSEGPATSAILAEPSNQDVQEVTDDQNNNLSKDAPLPAPAPAFANTDMRFSAGIRGKLIDKMIVMVRNFGG